MGLGALDFGALDFGALDFGALDFGALDFGALDFGALDFGALDFGALDFGALDFGALDFGALDFGALDFGALDFGALDFGALDFGALDFGALDFGALDFGALDFGSAIEVDDGLLTTDVLARVGMPALRASGTVAAAPDMTAVISIPRSRPASVPKTTAICMARFLAVARLTKRETNSHRLTRSSHRRTMVSYTLIRLPPSWSAA
jgi:hypothetical protein